VSPPKLELEVFVYGERLGTIRSGPQSRVRFAPDARWLRDGQDPRLGWSLLVDPRPRDSGLRLPPWFENLLPELGSPLRKRICAHHDLGEYDGPALLGALGADLPGAVEVRGWVDPYPEDESDDGDADDPQSFGDRLHFSVAGMQPKLSMNPTSDGRWILPAKNHFGSWYVKFAGAEFLELPAVEHVTMGWARAVGLDVPEHRLVQVEDFVGIDPSFLGAVDVAFAIKRFDRVEGARIHQEDFAQALEIRPHDKYGGPGRLAISYDSLARFVADACGEAGRDDFIQRVAFMVASGNDDAHLKNWSVQWLPERARPRLSPCYDLVSTITWPHFGWGKEAGPELALPFAGRKSLEDLDRQRLREFAGRANAPRAADLFDATLERARDSWAEHAEEAPDTMRRALAQHWERVPILRSMGGFPGS